MITDVYLCLLSCKDRLLRQYNHTGKLESLRRDAEVRKNILDEATNI